MNIQDFSDTSPGRLLRSSTGYWAFFPDALPPNLSWSTPLISSLTDAERNLARLAKMAETLPSAYRLTRPFIHREAVLSSRIEGTRASINDVFKYEANQLSFFEDTEDVREVHNYVRALDYALERSKTLPISLRLIREIHRVLMEGVRGEHLTPGEFRRSQNWIGSPGSTIQSAAYVPPPVDEMNVALDSLEKFISSSSEIPMLIRIGMIHYQFEAIHPFLDGNGRVGRLLIILLIIDWGLISQPLIYLSAFFEAHRLDYYDRLLAVSLRGEWESWLVFFLRAISNQSLDAVDRIEKLVDLRKAYQELVRKDRARPGLNKVIDLLFEHPISTIRQLENFLGVPYLTAARYVEKLVGAGILHEVTGRSRDRIYQADKILQAINK